MKMNDIWTRLSEDPIKTTRSVEQVPAHACLHKEAFCQQLFAKRAQIRHRVDAHNMALITLQTAHLRYQYFGPANLHAVDYMRNFHTGC
jgi:hypothetical protein